MLLLVDCCLRVPFCVCEIIIIHVMTAPSGNICCFPRISTLSGKHQDSSETTQMFPEEGINKGELNAKTNLFLFESIAIVDYRVRAGVSKQNLRSF